MSRTVRHRWVLTGTLVAESAVHVGGVGEGPATSLGAARDGQDCPLLPGTSLAGTIRAALGTLDPAEERLWGRISGRLPRGGDDGAGEASWVWVADATAPADTVPEVRESVSIDRVHGVAARGHLFTREVLPIGTRFGFQLRVDDPEHAEHDGAPSAAGRLVRRIADLLRGPSFTVGAATTRGLGRVRLRRDRLVLRRRRLLVGPLLRRALTFLAREHQLFSSPSTTSASTTSSSAVPSASAVVVPLPAGPSDCACWEAAAYICSETL